jgi:aminocarboxymuconate-semialdehyde decarboxylase
MRVIDAHFHWYPRPVLEELCARLEIPFYLKSVWYDLDGQLEHMDRTGRDIDVIASAGIWSERFCELPADAGEDLATAYNEAMAKAQKEHAGRMWTTAVVPLQDTDAAIRVLDHAITDLNLVGVALPSAVGAIGSGHKVDDPRLEPFYDRVEQLGVPLLLHPTDATFKPLLSGYEGALHGSLGRVVDLSVTAFRLVLSGILQRHPAMKVFMSHTGGALPYQAGRMDKNASISTLDEAPSAYLKRMYTDTVSPHSMGIEFAVEFYGPDQVCYGSDYPCWNPEAAFEVLDAARLPDEVREAIYTSNARSFFGLAEEG